MKSTEPYALIVEDQALILLVAAEILSDAGFRTLEADNADAALPVLDQSGESIILLFTDVDMPGSMNGIQLAHFVAANWPHIEIVVASGHYQLKAGDLPEKATFIAKPFSAEMVHSHLRETLPDGKKPEPLKQAV